MDHWSLDEHSRIWEMEQEVRQLRKRRPVDPLADLVLPPAYELLPPAAEAWEEFLAGRSADLARSIGELKDEMRIRTGLRDYSLTEIDSQIHYLQASLEEFSHWGVGYNTGVDVKRNWLEKQLGDLRKERRRLQVQCFADLVDLRAELREAVAEYHQLSRRQRLLAGGDRHGD
jgi:hypothetical protein